jgi:hypothetical protein
MKLLILNNNLNSVQPYHRKQKLRHESPQGLCPAAVRNICELQERHNPTPQEIVIPLLFIILCLLLK